MKISIITPTLNSEKYLEETLNSVKSELSQLSEIGEHIVQDGGSSDNTIEILKKYSKLYKLNYYCESDNNLSEAVNKGFRKAKGEILGWISSDNLYEKGTLNYVVNYFKNNLDVQFIYGHCIHIDEYGNKLYDHWKSPFLSYLRNEITNIYPNLSFEHFLNINPGLMVADCCYFIRREIYERWGYFFDERFSIAMDYELWLRVTKITKPTYINRIFGYYRKHPDQITAGNQLKAWMEILKINHLYGGSIWNRLHRHFYKYLFQAIKRRIFPWKFIK